MNTTRIKLKALSPKNGFLVEKKLCFIYVSVYFRFESVGTDFASVCFWTQTKNFLIGRRL